MNTSLQNLIYESDYRTIGYDSRNALPHHDNSIEIIQFWSDGGHFITRNNFFPIKPGLIIIPIRPTSASTTAVKSLFPTSVSNRSVRSATFRIWLPD